MKYLIIFTAVIILIYSLSGDKSGNNSVNIDNQIDGAWVYMQSFVEDRLKSPKSADFPFAGARGVTSLGQGRYKVQSYVDSQNSFGANIRTNFEGVIVRGDGSWQLEYLNFN